MRVDLTFIANDLIYFCNELQNLLLCHFFFDNHIMSLFYFIHHLTYVFQETSKWVNVDKF